LLLTLATVFVPMFMRRRDLKGLPRLDGTAALGYFALIGFGFMLVEIGLLSRLSVYLGHPILALAVLLGAIIFFSGIGALLSERVPIERRMVARIYPLVPAVLVLLSSLAGETMLSATAAATTPGRVMTSLALVAPPALGLGLCFPLGLRLVERMEHALGRAPALAPWLWGVNGAAGVCASGLALAISMVWGIPVTLFTGATCYVVLAFAANRIARTGGSA
jgi:hypothetical protein